MGLSEKIFEIERVVHSEFRQWVGSMVWLSWLGVGRSEWLCLVFDGVSGFGWCGDGGCCDL
jgi:hypothetical protein